MDKKDSISFKLDTDIKDTVITFLVLSTERFESETAKFISNPSDIETVHKMRLEIRKIRSILFFVKKIIKSDCYDTINSKLKFLNGALAAIRDLDILALNCKLYNKSDNHLINIVLTERTTLSNSFAEKISEMLENQKTLLFDWSTVIEWDSSEVYESTTYNYVKKELIIMLKKYLKLGKNTDFSVPDKIHQFRIAGKKIKSIIELFLPILDAEYHKLYKALKKILQLIGNIHDFYASSYILLELSTKNSTISYEANKLADHLRELEKKETEYLSTYWHQVKNIVKSILH